jgi:hypothetical protein
MEKYSELLPMLISIKVKIINKDKKIVLYIFWEMTKQFKYHSAPMQHMKYIVIAATHSL